MLLRQMHAGVFRPVEWEGSPAAVVAAEAARAKLVAGADFSALARELSEDASTKTNGGRLSWLPRGATDPAFEQGAFALRNRGELSGPIE